MSYLSKRLIMLFLLLLTLQGVVAQEKERDMEKAENETRIEQRAQERVDRLSETIELSEKEKQDLHELYIRQERERMKERALAHMEREKRLEKREKEKMKKDQELERILGKEKYGEYQRRKVESAMEKRDKIVDNIVDFMGDSFELDRIEREKLREYYLDKEKNISSIMKKIHSKQDDIREKMEKESERMKVIFGDEDEEIFGKEDDVYLN
ncbi:MAG: hypothetical protein GX042_08195 [Bacteroidales bacterium]|nr:hypothetical protein [Bacteroidales bacterium]